MVSVKRFFSELQTSTERDLYRVKNDLDSSVRDLVGTLSGYSINSFAQSGSGFGQGGSGFGQGGTGLCGQVCGGMCTGVKVSFYLIVSLVFFYSFFLSFKNIY